MKKIIIISVVIIILGAATYKFANFYGSLCDNPPIRTWMSPNQNHQVIYFQRGCDNTSPFIENIELDGKNILKVAMDTKNDYPLKVEWLDDNKLAITTASSTINVRIYNVVEKYNNIQIILDEKIKSGTKVE